MTFQEGEPDQTLPLLRAGELDVVLGFSYAEEAEAGPAHAAHPAE